ncbi:glycosyltransferase family 2 protein [Candidatus Woesearchaeota archaeon]|nr:glycosyltransferase family 2 protein [Candidatus Woesearchaeota archaeon]
MNPKILVGCPTFDGKGYCLKEYAEAAKSIDYDNYDILLIDNSETKDYYEKIKSLGIKAMHLEEKDMSVRQKISVCRNLLRQTAIEEYDYFLSLEQDVIPPKDIIKRLLSHNKKIISAVYYMVMDDSSEQALLWKFVEGKELEEFIKKQPHLKHEIENIKQKNFRMTRRYNKEEVPKNQIIKIAACGLGAVLIHKDVLKNIIFRSQEGKMAYDDMFFSQDALQNGFEIFTDTSVICKHLQDERFMEK